nr:RICIN domain-containing protein [Streptomyces sp. NBC_00857]
MMKKSKVRTDRFVLPIATVSLLAAGLVAPSAATAEDQYFYISNRSSGMVAEVFAHSVDNEARVVLWPNYGGDSEQFKQQFTTSGWFLLIAKHSGKCLSRSLNGGGTGSVVQSACDSSQLIQQWRPRQVSKTSNECSDPNHCFGGSRTVLDNKWNRYKCLDAANGKAPTPPAKGVALQTWPCIRKFSDWNVVNQEWELVRTQDWGIGPHVN